MKVKDLIEELQKADQEASVVIWDWNDGDERHRFAEPTINAGRFKGIFMLYESMRYRGEIELKD